MEAFYRSVNQLISSAPRHEPAPPIHTCRTSLTLTHTKDAQPLYQRTLEAVIDPSLLPEKDLREAFKFGTCAVVSNSGRLIGSKLGKKIDAHDAVFRLNEATVEGFEEDVGTKTTFRVVNEVVLHKKLLGRHEFLVPGVRTTAFKVIFNSPWTSLDLSRWGVADIRKGVSYQAPTMYSKWQRTHMSNKAYLISPMFNKHIDRLLHAFINGKEKGLLKAIPSLPNSNRSSTAYIWEPSTGLSSVLLALQMCDVVDVYEIVPSSRTNLLTHYWTRSTAGSMCPHSCEAERAFLQRYSMVNDLVTIRTGVIRLSRHIHPWLEAPSTIDCHESEKKD
ncbi:MAG: hypothetical protein SGPRY_013186 [Prymnesium sp.]